MKILTDRNGVVYHFGADDYSISENKTLVIVGSEITEYLPEIFIGNGQVFEVNENEIPAKVKFRYIYNGTTFIPNPQFYEPTEENIFNVFQTVDPNIPKTGDIDKRIEKLVNFVLEVAGKSERLFDVPEDLIEGLKLKDANINTLSGNMLRQYKIGQNYINKMKTRFLIEQQVGDVYDQIANLEKQLDLAYTMNLRAFLLVKNLYDHLSLAIPTTIVPETTLTDYISFSSNFLAMIEQGQYYDRIDVDNAGEVIQSILPKKPSLATIVKENYLDKYYIID
jgi:hypothetical protein